VRVVGRIGCSVAIAVSFWVAPVGMAGAEEVPACRIDGTTWPAPDFDRVLQLAASGPAADAKQMLGAQFAFFWGQSRDSGWYVGVAPGPVSVDAARAYLLERVDAQYSGADAELLRDRLHVIAQPYGQAELYAIQEELFDELVRANWEVGWIMGASCAHSDAWRLELGFFDGSSDAELAAARELTAKWGDRVLVLMVPGGPPRPAVGRALPPAPVDRTGRPLRVADLVAIGSCVRGSKLALRVRRSARAKVDRLTVTLRGRRRVFVGRRLRRPIQVKVKRGTRTLQVAVRLRDRSTSSTTLRLRRCRRSQRR
jgi:hypothetical protein